MERTHACTATLQALDVALLDLEVGCESAEDSIRRMARYFRQFGRRSNLLAFEAWGIQLESAPREVLAEQARSAVTGLRRVLALPRLGFESPRRVVLLEPDANEGRRFRTALAAPHRHVLWVRTTEEARTLCRTDMVDVLVVDLETMVEGGRELLVEIRERIDRTCAMVLVPGDDPSLQAECFALGADICFPKPTNAQVVATAVAAQLDRMVRQADLAVRDSLTGLVNRGGFEEAHRRVLADAARYDEPLSLALLDLDRFKDFNDRFGHPTGDRILMGVAAVLEERFREGDIVSRWGGEEFAVLLPRTSPAGAVGAVREVLARLRMRSFRGPEGGALPPVTFSAGVADGRQGLEAAVADADRRLYRAKEEGRARVEGPTVD
ncbi:MAG: GGDEF domain-containing response regulator [Gemmatimonadetes bacterium]|nr:GGDEF domain-containing response regulator [Gemmatimonadota bacterium]